MTAIVTIPRLIAWSLCGAGLFVLSLLFLAIRKAWAIQTWPETTGHISESETIGKWSQMGSSLRWIVEPKISYRYLLNGQEYVGHNIAAAEINTASKEAAEEKIEPFPVGQEVTVYYNPSKPEDSVLQKETSRGPYVAFGLVGVVFFAVGILGLFGVIHLNIR